MMIFLTVIKFWLFLWLTVLFIKTKVELWFLASDRVMIFILTIKHIDQIGQVERALTREVEIYIDVGSIPVWG